MRSTTGHLYASSTYLKSYGPIRTTADLAKADFVGIGNDDELLSFLQNWGLPITAENIRVVGESGASGWELARQGLGLITMTADIATHFPDMELVLPDLDPIPVPYWLTVHRELHNSKRIRLVYDHLADVLTQRTLPHAGIDLR